MDGHGDFHPFLQMLWSHPTETTILKWISWHVKRDGWKTILSFWEGFLGGAMLVSGNVICLSKWVHFSQHIRCKFSKQIIETTIKWKTPSGRYLQTPTTNMATAKEFPSTSFSRGSGGFGLPLCHVTGQIIIFHQPGFS